MTNKWEYDGRYMGYKIAKPKVDFIPMDKIEREADSLMIEYVMKKGKTIDCPPIPYEDILERHLGLDIDYPDLCSELGDPNILGALYVEERKVAIDKRLTEDPRFSFTYAHEIGHWVLHRHYYERDSRQLAFSFDINKPSIICRDGQDGDMETQANIFSACLLMPRKMFCKYFMEVREHYGLSTDMAKWNSRDEYKYRSIVAKVASLFGTSKESTRNRVSDLGLVTDGSVEPSFLDF